MLYVMLVGAYPFERPEDKHDSQKVQKAVQVGACCCQQLSLTLRAAVGGKLAQPSVAGSLVEKSLCQLPCGEFLFPTLLLCPGLL